MLTRADIPAGAPVYQPFGAVRDAFNCRDFEVCVEGPAGTGKTRAHCEKAHAVAERRPGSRQLFIRKTRASLTESVLVTFENKVLGPEHPLVRKGLNRKYRHSYDYPNGSTIVTAGMDTPERVLSTEWDRIYLFEAVEFVEDEAEFLITRLGRNDTVPYFQIVYETNPAHPGHWLNKRANLPSVRRIVTRHRDNPYLWDHRLNRLTPAGEQYMSILDRLSGHRRARLKDGKWAAAEGLVYGEYDASVNLIDKMPDGWRAWPKRRAIDFGYNDPFVCLWAAINDDAVYIYRQWYKSGMIVEDHARRIVQLSQGEEYVSTVADHDKEDRMTLSRHGVETEPANKDVESGIQEVKARLLKGGNDKPRIYILKSSLVERDENLAADKRPISLVDEFDCYLWRQRKDGSAKDEPLDGNDHACDALRYLCMSLTTGFAFVGY